MTTLTLLTLAVIVICAVTQNGYRRALAIGGATPIGAALVVGGIAIPTFYMMAIGALVGIVIRLARRTKRFERLDSLPIAGAVPLLLFAAWAIIVTLVAPLIFGGIVTLAPDGTARTLEPGVITSSNIAQIVYLILGISVVFFLARSRDVGPGIIGIASTLVTILCFWRYLSTVSGLPFPEGVFDNSPAYSFVESAPGGISRFRGIFSEPSGLATSSLVTIAYCVSRSVQVRGWHRAGVLVVAALAGFMASISTSATFVVALVALVALAAVAFVFHFVLRSGRLGSLAVLIGCVVAIVGVWVLPLLTDIVAQVVNDKVGSDSYTERSGADGRSYQIFWETYGFGVGLGAHRPSSFVAALLSTTGLLGTVLFVLAVFSIMRKALPIVEYRPVVWALTAMLITKVLASPDLADSSGILWMSLGALAFASHRADLQKLGRPDPALNRRVRT